MSSATAGPVAATGWPRRRLLVALLVISALLNVFFVAGAVWTRLEAPVRWVSTEQRYQQMAAQLDLTPQQRAAFDGYVDAMRARTEKMHQEIRPLIASTWDEMAKPDADVGQITGRFDEASGEWRQFQRESTAQTLDFLAILSPAQRSKFVVIARERRAPWLRPRAAKQ
ncbi:MAG: periplasmic heavy metal sensor [Stellaceae bacterium]